MKQHFTDEKTGIRYTLQGDYYLPDLALPAKEQQPIGIWGQRHLRHIKQNRRGARGYFVDTVGRNKEESAIYIKQKLENDQICDPLSLKEFVNPFTGSKNTKV